MDKNIIYLFYFLQILRERKEEVREEEKDFSDGAFRG